MPFRTCSNESLLPWLGPIVNIPAARGAGDETARLMNQKIAGRQVSVVAIAHRYGAIDASSRDKREAQLLGKLAAVIADNSGAGQPAKRFSVSRQPRAFEMI